MVRKIGFAEDLTFTGGRSKNAGLAKALAEKLNTSVKVLPHDPQLAGAICAALIAEEKLGNKS
jgi:activator of 2-hydroxyglutaryl-CoA dehydratase